MSGAPILIVDDNPSNTKLLAYVLQTEGYDVRLAGDADEAVALLEAFQPKLILMDLQLPGMDGLTLTRLLKAKPTYARVPIVAVTASAMKGDEERAMQAGCSGYITKPIDTRTLPRVVAAYLALASG
jgi:two-component system cell cycle response regulator